MRGTARRGHGRTSGRATAATGIVVAAASIAACTVPGGVIAGGGGGGGGGGDRFAVTVLSGQADQVSGGDALVQVTLPRRATVADLRVDVDGIDVTPAFADPEGDGTAVGVVEGLVEGENTVRAVIDKGRRNSRSTTATLVNHPIGGPIFSGPQQQPFVCTTARGRFDGRPILDQPVVDNQDAIGIPVAAEAPDGSYPQDGRGYPTADAQIVGWSANCAAETRYGYVYRSTTDGRFHWIDDPSAPPADTATTTTMDGHKTPNEVNTTTTTAPPPTIRRS